jgi:glutamate--cysteine ligase catalytic subunit
MVSEQSVNVARSIRHNASLPSLVELDELTERNQAGQRAFLRFREFVVAANNAAMAERPKDAPVHPTNGYAPESNGYAEEQKAAFQGPDPKKRRGVSGYRSTLQRHIELTAIQRAAPPGRCHSCNRAETPEWRRGPDGARTLCNACGLRKLII